MADQEAKVLNEHASELAVTLDESVQTRSSLLVRSALRLVGGRGREEGVIRARDGGERTTRDST